MPISMSDENESYVLFELAGASYALPSGSVQHIDMVDQITKVPNAHRAIEGVVFSRGQVIPALNLRLRFGLPRQEKTNRTRIIFAQVNQRLVGLIVDCAREFKRIPSSTIRPIEQTLTGVAGNYLKGLATINGKLVLLLDLEAVLNLDKDEALVTSISEVIATATAEQSPSAGATQTL
jgi:purine-binding chemotaxis protein CheW